MSPEYEISDCSSYVEVRLRVGQIMGKHKPIHYVTLPVEMSHGRRPTVRFISLKRNAAKVAESRPDVPRPFPLPNVDFCRNL